MKKIIKNTIKVFLITILVGLVAFAAYVMDYPAADSSVLDQIQEIQTNEKHELEINDLMSEMTLKKRDSKPTTGIILYPQSRMDSRGYIFIASELAKKDYFVVILKCLFNLPNISKGYAEVSILDFEEIENWYVGGFNDGGSVGSEYVNIRSEHPKIKGTILIDSYSIVPIPKDKKALVIEVESNSKMKKNDFEENKKNLPVDTTYKKVSDGENFYINTRKENVNKELILNQAKEVAVIIDDFLK